MRCGHDIHWLDHAVCGGQGPVVQRNCVTILALDYLSVKSTGLS
jgi:hypothetical protein